MQSATRNILLAVLFAGLSMSCWAGQFVMAPTTTVMPYDAMADAKALASLHSDARVMQISGVSMLPYFGEGALVVVKPIDTNKLRAGMIVVYTNRFGEKVAHRLIAQDSNGWVAKGFNNDAADSTPVTAVNLLGVVYATFHTIAVETDARMAMQEQVIETALAAPAK